MNKAFGVVVASLLVTFASPLLAQVVQDPHFPSVVTQSPFSAVDGPRVLGPPDGLYVGLGTGTIVYEFACDIPESDGADVNVYELDRASPESFLLRVAVSDDGLAWSYVTNSAVVRVRIPGDEAHRGGAFMLSYDIASTGLGSFRYVRIDGISGGTPGGSRGFDLDAIGAHHIDCTPSSNGLCPLTHGYWKNHPGAWPVSALWLGENSYDQDALLSVLRRPTKGNMLLKLATQLISVELSVANGSRPGDELRAAIQQAHDLIGAHNPTSDEVHASSSLGQQMEDVAERLDEYLNTQDSCIGEDQKTAMESTMAPLPSLNRQASSFDCAVGRAPGSTGWISYAAVLLGLLLWRRHRS